ncbi:hypothetical protein R9B83_00715 [Metamycoplasma equirhinis]|uniref:Uncharacterized protein n=1 Tax=Metamycoplasma equirhinis TaxID=92402 RepID=A0ABZ0PBS6_9BACT|nr:hypothetical protein [Metamycoplasma equirhinis]WPB54085.1 hypothetical protein R9B83_00715 [Metamycoplasma equirhinis]
MNTKSRSALASFPVLNTHKFIGRHNEFVSEINSEGHVYEFHDANAVKMATVHVVDLTIGKAILIKYLKLLAPSSIADSLTELGIASKAFLYINEKNIEAANGIINDKTSQLLVCQPRVTITLYWPESNAISGKIINARNIVKNVFLPFQFLIERAYPSVIEKNNLTKIDTSVTPEVNNKDCRYPSSKAFLMFSKWNILSFRSNLRGNKMVTSGLLDCHCIEVNDWLIIK